MLYFAPQIMGFMRRIGFRKEAEVDSSSPKRGVFVIGIAVVLFLLAVIV